MVVPDRFIPVAERCGFIVELGSWVLTTACSMAMHWMQNGCPAFVMSINVSPRQFRGDRLLADVKQCLRSTGLPPECLQIEITEGVLMQKRPEVEAVLQGLDELGVRVALDDFGTGYSSLSYLKRFPFHTLKIDREFVRDLETDEGDRALVTAAVRMGKALDLAVVAEGVETREQAAWLAEAGCDSLQGYFFDPPLSAEQLEERWLHAPQSVSGQA
jgi:EAL domain-containing protein (putative c-di-GMP-specific phosphodiesterase class I)